jgi:hypothetical protein
MDDDFMVITDVGQDDFYYPVRDKLIGRAVMPTRTGPDRFERAGAMGHLSWWWGECTLVKGDPVMDESGRNTMTVCFFHVHVRPRKRWNT